MIRPVNDSDQNFAVRQSPYLSSLGFPRIPVLSHLYKEYADFAEDWDRIDVLAYRPNGDLHLYTLIPNDAQAMFHAVDEHGDPAWLASTGNLLVRQTASGIEEHYDLGVLANKEKAIEQDWRWRVFEPHKTIAVELEDWEDPENYLCCLLPEEDSDDEQ